MTDVRIEWEEPSTGWSLPADGVDVWAASLPRLTNHLSFRESVLSTDEQARAARFRFDQDRNRFVAGRGLLRIILGRYLCLEPARLRFTYSSRGKPALMELDGRDRLHFNVAHSDDLVLVAVSTNCEVGVDVERVRPLSDAGDIAARYFTPGESAGLNVLPDVQKPEAFFNLWTRKEAWLKATAEGIGDSLNQVEVSFLPGAPAQLISLFGSVESVQAWSLWELAPAPGYVGALAAPVNGARMNCWRWPE